MKLRNKRTKRWLGAAFLFCLSLTLTRYWWLQEGQWDIPVLASMGTLKDKIICIDPGHGGRDPGAVWRKTYEKDINLHIAKYLTTILKKQGARVILTRIKDEHCASKPLQGSFQLAELNRRLEIAQRSGAQLLISIHCNSEKKCIYWGPQTFYGTGKQKSRELAREIQHQLVNVRHTKRRAVEGDYYLLRNSNVPAVIVEVGYLSHERDRVLLKSNNFRWKIAYAIAQGIVNYYN